MVVFSLREKYIKNLSLCLIKTVTVHKYLNWLSWLVHEHINVGTIE